MYMIHYKFPVFDLSSEVSILIFLYISLWNTDISGMLIYFMTKTPTKLSKGILSLIPTCFCLVNISLSLDENFNIIGPESFFKECFEVCLLQHLR